MKKLLSSKSTWYIGWSKRRDICVQFEFIDYNVIRNTAYYRIALSRSSKAIFVKLDPRKFIFLIHYELCTYDQLWCKPVNILSVYPQTKRCENKSLYWSISSKG